MPTVARLTDEKVARLPFARRGSYYVTETGISEDGKSVANGDRPVPGFGVRVFSARKTFVLRARGRTHTICPAVVPVKEARTRAREKILEISCGRDPAARLAHRRTARDLWMDYAELLRSREDGGDLRPSTAAQYRRTWEKDILPVFDGLKLAEVTAEAIGVWKRRNSHRPVAWNRSLQQLQAALESAQRLGWVVDNPATRVEPYAERPSARVLDDEEIRAWATALTELEAKGAVSGPAAAALWSLFYSGARPGEILTARVEWMSPVPTPKGMMARLDLPRSKGDRKGRPSGRVIRVPPPAGEKLLELERHGSPWLIPGPGGGHLTDLRCSFNAVCRQAGIEGATPKVLRHVWRSVSPEAGVSRDHIRQLGGWSSTKVMDGVYAHSRDRGLDAAAAAVGARLREVASLRADP